MNRLAVAAAGAILAALTVAPIASAQTVEALVARNLAAKGGADQIRAIRTIRQTSVLNTQGMVAEITVMSKRPNLMRQELRVGGETQVYGFDGQTPWMINPAATGSREAVPVAGPQAELVRNDASFDGPLVDYASRGTSAEFAGVEEYDGSQVHHIKLTSKTGMVQHVYLDVQTALERRIVTEGPAGRVEQVLSDYRQVEGMTVPFQITMVNGGLVVGQVNVQTVEFNADLDDSLFRMGGDR